MATLSNAGTFTTTPLSSGPSIPWCNSTDWLLQAQWSHLPDCAEAPDAQILQRSSHQETERGEPDDEPQKLGCYHGVRARDCERCGPLRPEQVHIETAGWSFVL